MTKHPCVKSTNLTPQSCIFKSMSHKFLTVTLLSSVHLLQLFILVARNVHFRCVGLSIHDWRWPRESTDFPVSIIKTHRKRLSEYNTHSSHGDNACYTNADSRSVYKNRSLYIFRDILPMFWTIAATMLSGWMLVLRRRHWGNLSVHSNRLLI